MKIVLEPEPSELVRSHACGAELVHLTPWRLPAGLPASGKAVVDEFVRRRSLAEGRGLPGYSLIEIATRVVSRGRTERSLAFRFRTRQLLAHWAASMPELEAADEVVAPSLSARRVFAHGGRAKKVLIVDLPMLRVFHEDLDAAARAHPDCAFLRRYRAPDWAIVEQEAEWAQADEIVVRGQSARDILLEHGVAAERIRVAVSPAAPISRASTRSGEMLVVRLAGLAAARHGSCELLSVLESRPWLQIRARFGEGAEPRALGEHPQVQVASCDDLATVDGVLAPTLCEAYLPEVRDALASGIPVIATRRGAGTADSDELFARLPSHRPGPGLARALGLAVDALRAAVEVDRKVPVYQAPTPPRRRPSTGPVPAHPPQAVAIARDSLLLETQ